LAVQRLCVGSDAFAEKHLMAQFGFVRLAQAVAKLARHRVDFLFAKSNQMTLKGLICWIDEVAKRAWILERHQFS